MPLNFQQVGLIALLFPKARFLHTTRDPIANGFSIYQQMFTGHHPYAHDLKNIADYYQDQTILMNFWKERFAGQIYEVPYEQLVTSPEKTCADILEFLVDTGDRGLIEAPVTVINTIMGKALSEAPAPKTPPVPPKFYVVDKKPSARKR